METASYELCVLIPEDEFGKTDYVWEKEPSGCIHTLVRGHHGEDIPAPSLSELVSAMQGDAGVTLYNNGGPWYATDGLDANRQFVVSGRTPEDALLKLWLVKHGIITKENAI